MQLDQKTYLLQGAEKPGRIALIIGVVGLGISSAGYFINPAQLFHSYLTAFAYWTSLALGGLFFIMLQHLTSSVWSVSLRRIPESLMAVLPLMFFLFIPVIFGLHHLYEWTHQDTVSADAILSNKSPYLNTPFFLARYGLFFLVWCGLSRTLCRISSQQDLEAKAEQNRKNRAVSAVGMVLFAFTLTFASIDWLMSLDAHWYSTIFGVYFFTGCLVGMITFITLIAIILRRQGILTDEITLEHYHDLGKLIFAFMVLWAYMIFSQYFLIWYANLPEETIWFKHRWEGSWRVFSLILVFGHFVIPFILLMSRAAKRNPNLLLFICIWFLIIHWVDLYWVIMPNLHKSGVQLSWMDLTATAGIGGFFIGRFWTKFTSRPIVPVNDPHLQKSIQFTNI